MLLLAKWDKNHTSQN